jgi:hypothetical protein
MTTMMLIKATKMMLIKATKKNPKPLNQLPRGDAVAWSDQKILLISALFQVLDDLDPVDPYFETMPCGFPCYARKTTPLPRSCSNTGLYTHAFVELGCTENFF